MTMTDTSRYARGARDDEARAAATAAYKKWRVRVARNGGLCLVDAAPTRHQIKMLNRRMTYDKMAEQLPVSRRTLLHIARGEIKRTSQATADAVEALWADYCGEVEKDKRRWPILPFKQAVIARYGTVRALGNTNQVRQIWRNGDISTKQAEDYAESLGLLPVEIWPDWYAA